MTPHPMMTTTVTISISEVEAVVEVEAVGEVVTVTLMKTARDQERFDGETSVSNRETL